MKELFFSIIKNPVFLVVLALKIIASTLFLSDIPATLFVPFLSFFGAHPLANPYQHFFELGIWNAFPYPTLMLWIFGLPFLLFSALNDPSTVTALDAGLLRFPLLLADIVILGILVHFNPAKKKLALWMYWASPVVFYINYIHGQLDIIPIALLLLSLILLFKEKLNLSALLLGLSLATKSHILVIIPFVALYLWKRKYGWQSLAAYLGTLVLAYSVLLLPYVSSRGFFQLVFLATEQFRLFDLAVPFSAGLVFYIVIAVYLYLVFKAFALRKLTKNILLMFVGVTFTMLVTLVRPAPGWYIWSVPFLVYFFVRQKPHLQILYWGMSALYFGYFFLIPTADIFRVFQLIAPGIAALPAPHQWFISRDLPEDKIIGLMFTLLSSALIYIAYLMFKYGIRTSIVFQEKTGIPVIGLAGDSGAGKTTTARFLTELFGEDNTTVICGDDIHRWERGHEKWSKYTHLNPISNRLHTHYSHIADLKRGKEILRPQYDHETGKFTAERAIKPKNYIIDEGLHTFLIKNKALHDLKIYLDPHPELNQYWKIERDVAERGQERASVLENIDRRAPDKTKYVLPQRETADIVIKILPPINPTEDFKNLESYRGLQLVIKTDINIDPLLETLQKHTPLTFDFEYNDHDHQQVTIDGHFETDHRGEDALKALELDYTEYGVQLTAIRNGMAGLIQLFILYCLHEKLKSQSVTEGELYA